MSNAFRKPKYGMVKVVKPAKVLPPKKPSVLKLKAIFKTIDTATNGLHLDSMSHAIYWWQAAMPYIKSKREYETISQTKLLLLAFEWVEKVHKAKDNAEKERCFIGALDSYRSWAKTVILTPPVTPHLKEMKKFLIKHKESRTNLNRRYDKLTTMLSQCFSSASFKFEVVSQCYALTTKKEISMKFDHSLQIMYLSKSLASKLISDIRKVGLLPVAIDCGYKIARAMSFEGMNEGKFVANTYSHLANYRQLMEDVSYFASSNPNAPNRLVRKTFVKPKKKKKENSLDYTPPDAVGHEDELKIKGRKKPTTIADLHKED